MSDSHPSGTSTSASQDRDLPHQLITLSATDIAATLAMAASQAAEMDLPCARITHFKTGLQWEISTFVTPVLQYSAAHNIISVMPIPVAHLLLLIPQQSWTEVPDHVFAAHLAPSDPSHIIPDYDTPWWMGHTTIPNEPWQWNRVMECCGFHYEHWLGGVEDDGLILLEMREGIRDKMGEIQMYTGILTRLQQARENHRIPHTEMNFRVLDARCLAVGTWRSALISAASGLITRSSVLRLYRVPSTKDFRVLLLSSEDWH
ncbi:uncharacterized protein EDB91DRAFT_1082112 [Suillus paluster]|uniref:uncharacterized protein n=1 Tax=Suillus paluster TaxID=48578 RepID=UPI001B85F0C7|nr:uncharacterized protein EDB91DRAFT_1082112 [Suillus paluster]KAG1740135.1 hypothetical protein EDB91DRAFT_1082112 [Suillus paluster]